MTEISDETITKAALAAQSHVLHSLTRWVAAGGDDAIVSTMARSGLIVDIVQFAAPLIAADERATAENLRRALKEAAAEMDRRYDMGAAAERERIRKRAEVTRATFVADGPGGSPVEVPFASVIDPPEAL